MADRRRMLVLFIDDEADPKLTCLLCGKPTVHPDRGVMHGSTCEWTTTYRRRIDGQTQTVTIGLHERCVELARQPDDEYDPMAVSAIDGVDGDIANLEHAARVISEGRTIHPCDTVAIFIDAADALRRMKGQPR